MEAKIDYGKSLVLTKEDHIQHLEAMATKRDEAAQQK